MPPFVGVHCCTGFSKNSRRIRRVPVFEDFKATHSYEVAPRLTSLFVKSQAWDLSFSGKCVFLLCRHLVIEKLQE